MSATPGFNEQLNVLVDRELSIQWGTFASLFSMLVQAPIIGALTGLAWKGQEPTPSTLFVMSVASLWMGCLNSCTAIVRERPIYERERMFDLDCWAYLASKVSVLAAVGAAQSVLLLLAQGRLMHLRDSLGTELLFFAALWGTNCAAAGLGLLVSTFAQTPNGAVVSIPVLLIPQVLFSEAILGPNVKDGVPSIIEKLTLTKWCYKALVNAQSGAEWDTQLGCLAALILALALTLAAARTKLRWDEL